jgi:PAS domain S-box-containing protein
MEHSENSFTNIPDWTLKKWQELADLLTGLFNIPVALIMKTEKEFMEVFITSNSKNNPYHVGDKEKWYGLYCETVIKTKKKLLIPNATIDKNWDKNPDIKLGMIAYLGFPINFPDGQPFGTICVLDDKEHHFTKQHENLLLQFKNILELDLILLQSFELKTNELVKDIKVQKSTILKRNIELKDVKEKAEERDKLLYKIAENYPNSYISIIEKNLTVGFSAGQKFTRQNLNPHDFEGLTLEQVFGKHTQIVKENYLKTFKGEETKFELFINNQHQLYKTVPLFDENNQISKILVVVENITDRKNDEQEILNSKFRLECLLEISQYTPHDLKDLLDYTLDVVIKLSYSEIGYIYFYDEEEKQFTLYSWSKDAKKECSVDNPQTVFDLSRTGCWGEAIRQRKPFVINNYKSENKYKKGIPKGHVKLHRFMAVPVFIDKKIVAVVGIANKESDYTETDVKQLILLTDSVWKMVEKLNYQHDIIATKDKLKEAQALAHIGHWELDLVNNKLTWSDEIFKIFGYKPQEFEATFEAFLDSVHPDDRNFVDSAYKEHIKSKIPYDIIHRIKLPNGEVKHVNDRCNSKFDENDNPLYSMGTVSDITSFILIENELKVAKEKAEESNKLKTEFLNNISHEIRTPMNGIIGFSRLLDKVNLTTEKKKSYINIIQSSGIQLIRIIDDILEISKLGTKQVQVKEKQICLNDLLSELFLIFDIKTKENKLKLYLKKGLTDKESNILIDDIKLNKILGNLLENALKYTEKGFIEFGYQLKLDCEPRKLEFYVKDTGIGIISEKQGTIFERFSQEDKEFTRKFGGLGLGLSIAKENAELVGGEITLISEKENLSASKTGGTTFFVSIPYKPARKNILSSSH